MGGHGAWISGINHPDSYACLSAAAGWIRKEEYGNANAFFEFDIQNSFISPGFICRPENNKKDNENAAYDIELKLLLEKSMSEFHVDKLVSNLCHMDVKIRYAVDFVYRSNQYRRLFTAE